MKTFWKKVKKTNKPLLILYLLSLVAYGLFYILFTIALSHLTGIETALRIIIMVSFGLWFIGWLLVGIISLFTKKYKAYVILMVFTILFTALFAFGNYYISSLYNEIKEFTKEKVTYTADLINLKDSEFSASSKIGMINDTNDTEGNVLAKKIISENNLNNEIVEYDDYYQMLDDLYKKKIDACFVSNNYSILFASEEEFQNIATDVKIVYTHAEEMDNQDNITLTNKKLTEPFTILVMGVDSDSDGLNPNQAFNGDTLMMITFNPKTLTASIFSIPRDTYVPIACRNGAYAKINSSAARGASCVISTISNLTGIDIDYYVKINFKGVVDLVNALGGVTVDVEEPYFNVNAGVDYHGQVCEQNSDREFGNKMVCLNPGVQVLNGEQALAYSRNRHQYIGSDLDRIRHQQDVVEAIVDKGKSITSFDQFKEILNAIQRNTDTNMTTDQILSLYSVGKSVIMNTLNGNTESLSIHRTYLETYSLPVWTGSGNTSALGYYQASLDDITKMMKINLGLEEATPNTTYIIDYNEDYTSKYYGKGLRYNPKEAIMANLIGSSKEYALGWANANGLTATIVMTSDSNYATGVVVDQSIHEGTLINGYSSVTLYVNNYVANSETSETENNSSTNSNSTSNKTTNEATETIPGLPSSNNNTNSRTTNSSTNTNSETSNSTTNKTTETSNSNNQTNNNQG
jgi:polyisoprenyl-teichoic acid--peptidoglycan teichoic acid transferase